MIGQLIFFYNIKIYKNRALVFRRPVPIAIVEISIWEIWRGVCFVWPNYHDSRNKTIFFIGITGKPGICSFLEVLQWVVVKKAKQNTCPIQEGPDGWVTKYRILWGKKIYADQRRRSILDRNAIRWLWIFYEILCAIFLLFFDKIWLKICLLLMCNMQVVSEKAGEVFLSICSCPWPPSSLKLFFSEKFSRILT